jgi:hypothetical protein
MLGSPLHEHNLLRFKVLIEDRSSYGRAQTAVVSFFDENEKRVSAFKFGVVDKDEIYAMIDSGADLALNNCYIKDFSLTEYRVNKGLDDSVSIQLRNFTAKKTFFDCDTTTDFSSGVFAGDKTNFESAIFGNGFNNFLNVDFGDGDVIFKKAKFGSGSTSFQSVKFGNGNISFNNTNFGTGNVSFVDTNFGTGDVDFKNTYFGDGSIDFKFAKFAAGDISFERAIFGKGKKDFKNVEFGGGKIDFRRVEFNDGDVSFEGVEYGDGKVTFRNCVFGAGKKNFELCDFGHGHAQFDLVDFGTGIVSFRRSKVHHISFTSCPLNCFMDLRFNQCDKIDLSNTIVRDIIDLKPVGETVIIKEMNLVDMRILGRLFINWRENSVYDTIYAQQDTSIYQKAEQFRVLKENFRNNGQYEDEDEAYVEFKRCEALGKLKTASTSTKWNYLWAYPSYYFQKYVFDIVGRYGTDPVRVLLNAAITVVIYGLIYFAVSEFAPSVGIIASTLPAEILSIHYFWNYIYYSAITFFTIGYGEYFPFGLLKILAALEGFSGVFLMSYFTVAFVRKILR